MMTRAELTAVIMASNVRADLKTAAIMALNLAPSDMVEKLLEYATEGKQLLDAGDTDGFRAFVSRVGESEGIPAPMLAALLGNVANSGTVQNPLE